jgi:hypothetical protein
MSLALGLVRRDPPTRLLFAAYVTLNLLDLLTTYVALAHGARELTPLYAALFAAYPYAVGALAKLLLASAFLAIAGILACAHVTPYSRAILRAALATLCALLAVTVLSNCAVLVIMAR